MSDENEQPAEVEMPLYKCHKQVRALYIKSVQPRYEQNNRTKPCTAVHIAFEEPGFEAILETGAFFEKHSPRAGDVYVVYPGGYKSVSPAKAFEEGYTLVEGDGESDDATPEPHDEDAD